MTTTTDAAKAFRAMADRLEKGDPKEFGGAFLIIPPDGYGLDGYTATTAPSVPAFWATLQGQVEVAIELVQRSQQPGAGGGYR